MSAKDRHLDPDSAIAAATAAAVATPLSPPERVTVAEDAFRVLAVTVDGRTWTGVRAVRVFPMSGKANYVSFLDGRGKEVAIVADPHRLDKESRRVLEHVLERHYYVPRILEVHRIRENHSTSFWEVITDRGYASFEVVDREFIRKLPGGRMLLTDADGNRFEIPDIHRLDKHSRDLVESET